MPIYYCDLGQDFIPKSGADKVGNQLLGPAGLQAAIRGDGAGPVTQLVAGDTVEIKGTGDISLLVDITCGKDVSAWAAGDRVRDNTAGAHWTCIVAQEFDEVPTGLTDNTHLLVQLDDTCTYDDLNDNQGDGIENQTAADNTTISAVACPGIYVDGYSGDEITGYIRVIGVSVAWAIPEDGNLGTTYQAILDGQDDDNDKKYWELIKELSKSGGLFSGKETQGFKKVTKEQLTNLLLSCYKKGFDIDTAFETMKRLFNTVVTVRIVASIINNHKISFINIIPQKKALRW